MRSTFRFKSRMSDSQTARPFSTAPSRLPSRQAAPLTAKTIVAPTVTMAMMMGVVSVAVFLIGQPRSAYADRQFAAGSRGLEGSRTDRPRLVGCL